MWRRIVPFCSSVTLIATALDPRPLPAVELDQARHAVQRCSYDEAERLYRSLVDGVQGAQAAAELAAIYEQLGEIDAAAEMYEKAVARGGFSQSETQRLTSQLDHCRRQRPSLIRFPVSVEAETDVKQIEALMAGKQWPAAIRAIGSLLERFGGTFLQRGAGQYLGIGQWARTTLEAMPEEGRVAYVAWSERDWLKTLEDASATAITNFTNHHPGDPVLGNAVRTWAQAAADQGRTPEALGLLARCEPQNELDAQRVQSWSRLAATAPAPAAHSWSPAQVAAQADLGLGMSLELQPGDDPPALAIDAGRLFLCRQFRVEAYDLRNGRPLWTYVPTEPMDRLDGRRDIFGKTQYPRQKWVGAIDASAVTVCPTGILRNERYHHGRRDYAESTLTCLNEHDGTVRWRLDRDPVMARMAVSSEPVYSGGKILVTAFTRGEFPEYWLCAFDAADGTLLWRQRIAVGATPTRCVGRGVLHAGQSGPALAAVGEMIYYASHMGAVIAVDRDLGQLVWAVSYPRVPRFGPVTQARLPLLERQTEPIRITSKYLVVLPRDLNGLLIIDRQTGRLQRIIRSLDLRALVHADDDYALVTTIGNQVRCYRIEDGSRAWLWGPPEGDELRRPCVVGDQVLATHGKSLTRLLLAGGTVLNEQAINQAAELSVAQPAGQPVLVSSERVLVLGAEANLQSSTPPDAGWKPAVRFGAAGRLQSSTPDRQILRAVGGRSGRAWTYEAFLPGRAISTRLAGRADSPSLMVAGTSAIEAYSVAPNIARNWVMPIAGDNAVWAAPEPGQGSATEPMLVVSEDREHVKVVNLNTGMLLGAGDVSAAAPIRELAILGDSIVVVGTSHLACVRMEAREGGKDTGESRKLHNLWHHDFSPCALAKTWASNSAITAMVQPAGSDSARVVKLDSKTGKELATFVVAAPLPGGGPRNRNRDDDSRAIQQFHYQQSDLRADEAGYLVTAGGKPIRLSRCAMRCLGEEGEYLFVDIADYWGAIDRNTGDVTLLTPAKGRHDTTTQVPAEQALIRWVNRHRPGRRGDDHRFTFEAGGLRYLEGACGWFHDDDLRCGRLVESATEQASLAAIRPERIDQLGDWLMVDGEYGTLILHRGATIASQPADLAIFQPADLFEPRPVAAGPAQGLTLDGALSDWPAGIWPQLPALSDNAGGIISFQWAADPEALWLAVRIQHQAAGSESPANSVEVLLVGAPTKSEDPSDPSRPASRILMTLSLVAGVPVATIQGEKRPVTYALPAGDRGLFDLWLRRQYGTSAAINEGVVFAAEQDPKQTTYELRLARSLLTGSVPTGFDLRIRDAGGPGSEARNGWCGALWAPSVFPPAPLTLGASPHE